MSGLGIVTGRAQPCGAFRIRQMQCPSSSAPPHGRCFAAPVAHILKRARRAAATASHVLIARKQKDRPKA